MMEFDDFSDKKTETERILEKRSKIKDQLNDKLVSIGFSDAQIREVFEIIDIAEAEIDKIKSTLNGTNINNDDPTPIMTVIMSEVRTREYKMGIDIREKINEIIEYNSGKKSS